METDNRKRILITGAAGFIGFHLAERLNKLGYSVVGMDNFNDYYAVSLKRDRAKILKEQGIDVVEDDITIPDRVYKLLVEHDIGHLVHLAAQAGVRYSLSHPQHFLKTNIDGFMQVLEAAKKRNIPLVYASSSSVYGLNEKVPYSTQDQTDRPANIYAVTKKTNELMAFSYQSLYKFPTVGLRFFTVYGPWGRPDMACFSFTKKIFAGEPVDLYNFGNMRRDFTYVDDVVSGIISSLSIKEGYHIYNLGNHRPESLHTLIEIIEKESGKKCLKNLLPCPVGEIVETRADITESRKNLQFEPKTSLQEGMRHFIKWYKSYYGGCN